MLYAVQNALNSQVITKSSFQKSSTENTSFPKRLIVMNPKRSLTSFRRNSTFENTIVF